MATVNAVVLKHHKKENGTWNVKISISHQSKTTYIDTTSFIDKSYLDSKGKLKKAYIDKFFSARLNDYRNSISDLGAKTEHMSCVDIKEYLKAYESRGIVIDFFKELEYIIEGYKDDDKNWKASIYKVLLTHLKDFIKKPTLNINDVTPSFLYLFEQFLRKDKTRIRISNTGIKRTEFLKGITSNGVINYMASFSNCISILEKKYNNPMIHHMPVLNPFKYYKSPKATLRKKRNLDIDRVVQIFKFKPKGFIENMCKDLFVLSFYLCGMNQKDMYVYLTDPTLKDKLEYGRSKIKNKRSDGGLTNVGIPNQIRWIIEKYSGVIQSRYCSNLYLNQSLSRGWKSISEKLEFKVTMYYARHTFARLARSSCKFPKDDVSFALNHKFGLNITDVYTEPDWSVVHMVQSGVIKYIEEAIDRDIEE